jgi:hypothetical protein
MQRSKLGARLGKKSIKEKLRRIRPKLMLTRALSTLLARTLAHLHVRLEDPPKVTSGNR